MAGLLAAGCTDGGEDPATATPSPTAAASPSPAASPTEDPGPREGGTLRFALGADPVSIDPRFVADSEGRAVVDALFDSLVRLDENLEVQPAAAESWEVSEDGTRFEFTLRRGATFHNGRPVRAQDFVRAFNRMADGTVEPRSFVAYLLAPVEGFEAAQLEGESLSGLEAVDERTLVITLSEPFFEFLEVLADPSLAPVPPAARSDEEGFAITPNGNGPFQLAGERAQGDFVRVSRFTDYAGDAPWLDEIVFQIYSDDPNQRSQYAAFEDGRLHVAEIPAERLEEAVDDLGAPPDGYTGPGAVTGLTTTIYYYGFNTEQPPFDDPNVRRAISLLIDREAIVSEITSETREVADSIVPRSLPGYQEEACPFCAYDEARALSFWQGHGEPTEGEEPGEPVDRGEGPLTMLHNEGRTHSAIAKRIASAIEDVLEIEVEVRSLKSRPFIRRLREGEMGIFRFGWQADYPSAGSYLQPLFSSKDDNLDNLSRYHNDGVDELLAEARAEPDPDTRVDLYRRVERHVLRRAIIAPIFVYRFHRVVAPAVQDFRIDPFGNIDLTAVWLDESP